MFRFHPFGTPGDDWLVIWRKQPGSSALPQVENWTHSNASELENWSNDTGGK